MLTLSAFKQNLLTPLLRGEPISSITINDTPVWVFAATVDFPLRYVFETERWDEVSGASRRLARVGEKLITTLAADSYSESDLLHCTPTSLIALCHDLAIAQRWSESIERAVAAETDIVTISTIVHKLTVAQLTGGLYRAPRSVIGVPGVNDYQERINRYYGLNSPSTVPREEQIAQRRHFGETLALIHTLLDRARESRQIVPFYESLPFAERCDSCQTRPAERLDSDDLPVCGVCLRKRSEPIARRFPAIGLIKLEVIGLRNLLEAQHSPSAYRKTVHDLTDTFNRATEKYVKNSLRLASGLGWQVIAAPAQDALEFATTALEQITLHYGMKLPASIVAGVALGDSLSAIYHLTDQISANFRRTVQGTVSVLDVRHTAVPFDRFRLPFTLDEARQLIAGIGTLKESKLPATLFAELPEQMARGSAGLYYTFERSKLPQTQQQVLQRLERAWDVGAVPTPRFFTMLSTLLALVDERKGA